MGEKEAKAAEESRSGGGDRLDGWKAIGQYLGRDGRTAQRWATERNLPVHRTPGAKRSVVYAFKGRLDEWLKRQPEGLAEPEGIEGKGQGWTGRLALPRWVAWAGLGLVVLAAGAGAVRLLRGSEAAAVPDRFTFEGNKLVAWDSRDHRLWEHAYPKPVGSVPSWEEQAPDTMTRVADLDGDGDLEALVVVAALAGTIRTAPHDSELDCFEVNGRLLWSYKPSETLRFGGTEYSGPWHIRALLVSPEKEDPAIWIAVTHNLWWPSFVVRVDPRSGKGQTRFVNSGFIVALERVKTPAGHYLLAGGYDNEYGTGVLAVLDEKQVFASSPQADPTYHCDNCPAGLPVQYFRFPRGEVNRGMGDTRGTVASARSIGGDVEVLTCQAKPNCAGDIYTFAWNGTLSPRSVAFNDGYWIVHRRLEEEGKLTHTAEQCPERTQPRKVKMWTPQAGWVELSVPVRLKN